MRTIREDHKSRATCQKVRPIDGIVNSQKQRGPDIAALAPLASIPIEATGQGATCASAQTIPLVSGRSTRRWTDSCRRTSPHDTLPPVRRFPVASPAGRVVTTIKQCFPTCPENKESRRQVTLQVCGTTKPVVVEYARRRDPVAAGNTAAALVEEPRATAQNTIRATRWTLRIR
jgi:hypothetical protein